MKKLLLNREKDTHKGTYGRVAIIAGSRGMTGAAYLVSQSALRTGSGLVYTVVPESLETIMSIKLTEAIVKPIYDRNSGFFVKESLDEILEEVSKVNVIALGPGIGVDEEKVNLVREIIKNANIPMVIDADGLNCIGKDMDMLKEKKGPIIVTPHPGEMGRLLNKDIKEIQGKREYYASYMSDKYNVTTVLKGAGTIVASPEGEIYLNATGNPGMSTAGTGDVLTGMITSLLGQGLTTFNAGKLGVYLHGLSGDIAREEFGEYSMIARDLIEYIPQAIKKIKLFSI